MPLIKCVDCGKEISDRIDSCPFCGCPVSVSISGSTVSSHSDKIPDAEARELCRQADKYYNKKEYNKAFDLYQKAADLGYSHAQYQLGTYYQSGLGGVEKNYALALQWYNKAAEQNNPNAWNNLGSMYSNGLYVPQDKTKALQCYLKASDLNSVTAPFNVAVMYENGIGTEKDRVKATHFYQLANERGYNNAILFNNLGVCYMQGIGVNVDYVKAKDLFTKAIEQGNKQAESNLELLNQLIAKYGVISSQSKESAIHSSSKDGHEKLKNTKINGSVFGKTVGIAIIIIGVIVFIIGACTGTITGYQGLDGQYYADPDAVGSREWMCIPAAIMVVVGIAINKISKRHR